MSLRDEISKVLSAHWGLRDCQTEQIYDTAWQVADNYVLKVYQNVQALERNLKILRLLDQQNIPVAQIVPTCSGASYVSNGDTCYFLSEKLPGEHISQIDENIAYVMGRIIAGLHTAFQKCEPMDTLWNNSLLDEMNGWVKESMEKNSWRRISKMEYERTVAQLAAVYNELPVQLIHRDIHFGNFLFADGVFSGYIDFDLSQRNIRIFDLCYFMLGLLSEQEEFEITEETWFHLLGKVFTGYESVRKLSVSEKNAVPCVMGCIELLFTAYYDNEKNDKCAENAFELYEFVRQQGYRIAKTL